MKKELIYIANARIPTEKAHGIQIMKMCESFVFADDLKVTLVLPRRLNQIKQDSFDYYQTKKVFEIKKIPCLDLISLGIPKIGFTVQNVSFAFFAFFYVLFKKKDIIYSRDFLPAYLLSFFKNNVVYELHNIPLWLRKKHLERIKKMIVITQGLKKTLVEKGVVDDKILVASDGVDLKQFDVQESQSRIRKRLSLPLNKKIVLYSGHLYQWKGADTLAQAARYLSDDCVVVFIGGTENDIEKFKKRSKQLNFKNILILGYQPYSQIPYYLKVADVLVLPNSAKEKISRLWTSPMKMFEYMTSRRPIVASDLPSIREVLNENNAVLTQPDNPRLLANAITNVLANKDFSNKLSQRAYADVGQYDWFKRAKKILNFINTI